MLGVRKQTIRWTAAHHGIWHTKRLALGVGVMVVVLLVGVILLMLVV